MNSHTISQAKPHRLQKLTEAFNHLQKTFPHCFAATDPLTQLPKPLKLSIHKELLSWLAGEIKPPFSKTILRQVLFWYTHQGCYRKAILQRISRVDLTGAVVSAITEKQIKKLRKSRGRKVKEALLKQKSQREKNFPEESSPLPLSTQPLVKKVPIVNMLTFVLDDEAIPQ